MSIKSILATIAIATPVIYLLNSLGFSTKIVGLKSFADKAVLKLRRIYSLAISPDYQKLTLKIDLEVENNSLTPVLATNLIVNAYNDSNQLIGRSEPYPGPIKIAANTPTTISGIELQIEVSTMIESYGAQAWELLKTALASMSAEHVRLNEDITLDVFITLNGISVNQKINYTI